MYDAQVRLGNLREIEHLPANGHVDVVWTVFHTVRRQLARREHVLRWADEVAQYGDDEDRTTTGEPNENVQREFFTPCLPHVHALHAPEPPQERRRHPPRE